jgi:hypothetical protein
MKEASPVKYYFAKYFFLAFGLLQWSCGMLLFLRGNADETKRGALIFFILGLAFIALYFAIAARLKRVAISKKRVTIIEHDKADHYEWPEVKYIRTVPYFNLYKLKLRGRKGGIYFLPDHNVEPLFGLFQHEPEFVNVIKKKK